MRRAVIVLIAVMMCAGYSFGQSNGLPQWKVVKEVHINGGTSAISPVTLFTPTRKEMYRIGFYLAGYTQGRQNTGWTLVLDWTDQTGISAVSGVNINLFGGNVYKFSEYFPFSPEVGTPVSFQIKATDPQPNNATYDAEFSIEKLTH